MTELICFAPTTYQLYAEAKRTNNTLHLSYSLTGVVEPPIWPEPSLRPTAQDKLYTSTCFEAFLGLEGSRYLEVNVSPSGDWQYYWFDNYRLPGSGGKMYPPVVNRTLFGLKIEISLAGLQNVPDPCHLGLSAVIEFADGKDYWALRHCADKPDFHLRESFILAI